MRAIVLDYRLLYYVVYDAKVQRTPIKRRVATTWISDCWLTRRNEG